MLGLSGSVLITGGAGFLGRGIMRRAKRDNWPCEFTVYSRDEQKQDAAKRKFPNAEYVLGDICDFERLTLVMKRHDVVIHAAAIKYIPEGEFNAFECTRVNVDGTRVVLDAVRHNAVEKFIAISTDKAVLPINTYGATKMLMERLVSEMAMRDTDRAYTLCRYGNVVGSTGSVIPVFLRQFSENGYVTITDPEMTRFWISIDEAVDLVIRAAKDDVDSGAIVIPQPKAMRLSDLADVITSGGAVDVIGKRPGEKMHEDLLSTTERARAMILDSDFYQLMPPGYKRADDELIPKLTSENPREWVTAEEMHDLIEDSVTV